MYVYFNDLGIIKECVNDEYLRVGNNLVNDLYLYFDGNRTVNQIVVKIKQNNGDETVITHILDLSTALVNNAEIPYNPNRDLKYFKYYTPYKFYKYSFDSDDLAYSGVLEVSVVAYFSNENMAMGKLILNVENSLVETDTTLTRGEYNSLLRDISDMTNAYVDLKSILGSEITEETLYFDAISFEKKVFNVEPLAVNEFYAKHNRFVYQDDTTKQIILFKRVNQYVVGNSSLAPYTPFNKGQAQYEGIDGFGIKYIVKFFAEDEDYTCEIAYETPQNDNVPCKFTDLENLDIIADTKGYYFVSTTIYPNISGAELKSREVIYTKFYDRWVALQYSSTRSQGSYIVNEFYGHTTIYYNDNGTDKVRAYSICYEFAFPTSNEYSTEPQAITINIYYILRFQQAIS